MRNELKDYVGTIVVVSKYRVVIPPNEAENEEDALDQMQNVVDAVDHPGGGIAELERALTTEFTEVHCDRTFPVLYDSDNWELYDVDLSWIGDSEYAEDMAPVFKRPLVVEPHNSDPHGCRAALLVEFEAGREEKPFPQPEAHKPMGGLPAREVV